MKLSEAELELERIANEISTLYEQIETPEKGKKNRLRKVKSFPIRLRFSPPRTMLKEPNITRKVKPLKSSRSVNLLKMPPFTAKLTALSKASTTVQIRISTVPAMIPPI